jgi:hypothetical protein
MKPAKPEANGSRRLFSVAISLRPTQNRLRAKQALKPGFDFRLCGDRRIQAERDLFRHWILLAIVAEQVLDAGEFLAAGVGGLVDDRLLLFHLLIVTKF